MSLENDVLDHIKKHQKKRGKQARFNLVDMLKVLEVDKARLGDAINRLRKRKKLIVKMHKEFSYEIIGE